MTTTGMPADVGDRADAVFVTHVTWALQRTPGMSARIAPELVVSDSGLRCDTFNFICRARLPPEASRTVAAEAISYFTRVERPFSWWVGPSDRPGDLGTVLEELGLERAETELAMAVPLAALRGPPPELPGLDVRRVAWAPTSAAPVEGGRDRRSTYPWHLDRRIPLPSFDV